MTDSVFASFSRELVKLAEDDSIGTKAIRTAATARPWAKSAVEAGVPVGVASSLLFPKSRKAGVIGVGTGAAAGVANRALEQWAKRHKGAKKKSKRQVATQILKQGSALDTLQNPMRKAAAMAADLRVKGLGGVKRPPFPTEGSKSVAFGMLNNSQRQSQFAGAATPKTLTKPGPTIKQLTPSG